MPELAARRGDLDVAVEVYAPREWQRLADFTDDLAARLRHLDRPFDYTMELSVGRASALHVDGCLTSMHPGPVDAGLEADAVRNAIVNAIAGGIDAALAEGRPPQRNPPRRRPEPEGLRAAHEDPPRDRPGPRASVDGQPLGSRRLRAGGDL